MKKLFALLLAAVMVISMAACAPAEPAGTTAGKADNTEPAKTTTAAQAQTTTAEAPNPWNTYDYLDLTGIVADNKINVGIPTNATVMTYEDNDLTKYLEEITGLEIEFTFFSSDATEKKQQLSLMVANQEKLPDVLLGVVDKTMASELGQEGLLCDLTEFLDKSPRLQPLIESMNDYEKTYFLSRLPDGVTGEIYHVPTPYINAGVDSQEVIGAVSMSMAAKVNMDPAEIDTVDEVYEYLKAVVNNDGNGNGEADEIGMLYRPGGYRADGDEWIINAYIFCCDKYLFNVEDGIVYFPYNQDEYREAMITLNKWYAEGLISPLTFSVQSDAEVKALVDVGPGNYKIGIWSSHPTLVCESDSVIGEEYTYINTLADETGRGGYASIRDTYSLLQEAVIPMNEAEPERMELAYLFCDLAYVNEVYMHWRYGVEGENWEFVDGEAEGLKDSKGNWAGFRILNDTWSTETDDTWHYAPLYGNTTGSLAAGLTRGGVPSEVKPGVRGLISSGNLVEKLEHERPAEQIFNLVYNEEENEVINDYLKLYEDYMAQARAQMITGVIDPNDDAQWAKYLAELKANGEDELIEAAQGAYDRMNG